LSPEAAGEVNLMAWNPSLQPLLTVPAMFDWKRKKRKLLVWDFECRILFWRESLRLLHNGKCS